MEPLIPPLSNLCSRNMDVVHRDVHDMIHSVLRDVHGFIGTVAVGSVAYLGSEGTDLDILFVTHGGDWPNDHHDCLARLHALLTTTCLADNAILVSARVPVLKCAVNGHAVDILHDQATCDDAAAGGQIIPLDRAVALLPGNSAVALAHMLHTCLLDHASPLTPSLLRTVRQWAKGANVYGTCHGFPGGSAWAVAAQIACNVLPAPVELQGFLEWLCHWLRCYHDVPMTLSNARALATSGALAWAGLSECVCRFGKVMWVLPFPTGPSQFNMTQTVGPLQHQVLLYEIGRALQREPSLVADVRLVFTMGASTASSTEVWRWRSHVESQALLTLTNQLHTQGVFGRIAQGTPDVVAFLDLWLGTSTLSVQNLMDVIRAVLGRVERMFTAQHGRPPPCAIHVSA